MRTLFSRLLRRWRLLLLVTLLGGIGGVAVIYQLVWRPNLLVGQAQRCIVIPRNATFDQLLVRLQQEAGLLHPTTFRYVARLLRYYRLRPGYYQLQSNMNNWAAVRLLRGGVQQPVRVTFAQVRTKADLVQQLTQNLGVDPKDFLALLQDEAWLKKYGFTPENVLTMFVPDTYEAYWTISAEGLFERMYQGYQRFWTPQRRQQAAQWRLSPIQVAILASVVQEETNLAREAPIIAGVYLNRLRRRIALQADPTLKFALGDPTRKRILNKDKKIDSPYNTYRYRGLPPRPICVPTQANLQAVLEAERHKFFYFAAKHDLSGEHHFSADLRQHTNHARRYRRTLSRARIYR